MMSMNIDDRIKLSKDLKDVELLTETWKNCNFRWENDENLTV